MATPICDRCGSPKRVRVRSVAIGKPSRTLYCPCVHRFHAAAWIGRNPEKRAAHKAVEHEIKRGGLVRQPCEVCGGGKSEAHHDDYRAARRPMALSEAPRAKASLRRCGYYQPQVIQRIILIVAFGDFVMDGLGDAIVYLPDIDARDRGIFFDMLKAEIRFSSWSDMDNSWSNMYAENSVKYVKVKSGAFIRYLEENRRPINLDSLLKYAQEQGQR